MRLVDNTEKTVNYVNFGVDLISQYDIIIISDRELKGFRPQRAQEIMKQYIDNNLKDKGTIEMSV